MIGPHPVDETRIDGGVQAAVHGLCRRLVATGAVARLEVIATPRRVGGVVTHTRVGDVPVTHLTAPWRFLASSVLHVPKILRGLRGSKRRIVHLHGSGLFEAALLVGCLLRRVPVVWTLHGLTEKETRDAWLRAPSPTARLRHLLYAVCERLQLRLAQSLIVDTPYVARAVARRARAVPAPIPQGIDFAEFAAARAAERHGRLVVSVGVFHPRKGHDRTLAAFARVVARFPDARLELIGTLVDPAHFAELEASVRRLGLADEVRLRPDLPRAEVLDALGRARLFALHSQEESQGIAVCEAMAAGLPVVLTRAGGLPDVVADTGAGRLVDFDDVEGFADAVVELLGDDRARATASAAAIARARDFDWSDILRGVVERYRLAIAGRPNTRLPHYPDVRSAPPSADE
ncbi:MAG: glycosyltransferase family 4 protein [Phyllobacteriaceae bacterium]|nr:glycosyltransferase family 4 protein [Phyllobacteriaceae bacterium]